MTFHPYYWRGPSTSTFLIHSGTHTSPTGPLPRILLQRDKRQKKPDVLRPTHPSGILENKVPLYLFEDLNVSLLGPGLRNIGVC